LKTRTDLPDIQRAAYFYQLIRQSYASGLDSFGAQPHSMWANFPLIRAANGRLQKVVVENKDFEQLIRQYDRPDSFFYCDPPYFATWTTTRTSASHPPDQQRLADMLCGIEGKIF
jgi:DNA adenine methylase